MKNNNGKAKGFFAKLRWIYGRSIVTETKSEDNLTDNVNLSIKWTGRPTRSEAVIPSRFVIQGFLVVFLFTIVILGSLVWYTWRSNQHLKALETKHFRLLELSGQIIYLDEVLTMSAEVAAHSGELEWEDRYRIYEPQLDKAIKEVIELSPEKFMSEAIYQTDAANIKLVAMEYRAFDLIRQGQQQEAAKLIHSPEYKNQKQVYSEGINEIANAIDIREKARLKKEQRIALITIVFLIITMPLVAFIWLAALWILRRYIAERRRTEFTLRMSEQCFSAIADYSYFWEIWVNPAGRPVWTNPAVQRITGYSIQELMAMSYYPAPLIYEQDRKRMIKAFNSALEGTIGNEVEFHLVRKDGAVIWAEASWKPIYDKKNAFIGYRASIRDITDRKRAEQEVIETQERFSDFFKNAPIGFHIFGPDQIIIDINDAELEMIGYSRDEIVGKKTWAEFIIPEERQQFKEHWRNIISKGQVINHEYTLVRKDGHHINVIFNASSRFDKNGNLISTRGSVLNITERKQISEALQKSQERFRTLVERNPYGIQEIDACGTIIYANKAHHEMYGYQDGDLIGRLVTDFLALDSQRDELSDYLKVLVEDQPPPTLYYQKILTAHGEEKDIEVAWDYLRDTKGRFTGFISVLTDITERKQAEQALHKLTRELDAKNKELESILYAVSHDLKSPLVNIQGFGYELSQSYDLIRSALTSGEKTAETKKSMDIALNEDIPNALDFILASGTKMDSLLSGLLDYCRLGTAVMDIKSIDMNTMMADVSGNMEYQIKEAKAKVDIEPLRPCLGDSSQINRIFTNLLTNALKFLDESRPGQIRIYGISRDEQNIYCIEDNGIGIAPEHLEEIFEIFYQLEPEKRKGDGLGLTIVKRIIDRHNGRIWVESEAGKGSKVFVSLQNV
ncbi:MAG: PAS domain S-box protein [Planctomycetes bacterium]|nr:PAS domain S-box protein [Planctomycetota bacterium]